MRKQIANLTSSIFSPFLVALVLIILVSFESMTSISQAIYWSLIMIALSVLPIYLVTVYLVRGGKIDSISISIQQNRTKIYILVITLGGVGLIILLYLNAPVILLALFATGLITSIIFMCINFWWKISIHTAFIMASVAVLVILCGFEATALSVLIPLVAWSRIELEHHSVWQVVSGGVLATLILVGMFYLFGLL